MRVRWYNRQDWDTNHGNIGDMISPLLSEFILDEPVTYSEEPGSVLGCGSILEFIQPNDILLGCGLIEPMVVPYHEGVKIVGVRGALSLDALTQAGYNTEGALLFDPAVFMPLIYNPNITPAKDTVTIPHYIDNRPYPPPTLSPMTNYKKLISEMCSYHKIKTNSLHIYILAEAYGIEVELMNLHKGIIGGTFKYEDYQTSNKKITLNQIYERMSTLSIY